MAERQVTLRDIAKKANVSTAAVSNALHGKGRMSSQTRDELERLLKEAGYKPSYKLRPVLYITSHRMLTDMHSLQPMLSKYEGLNAHFQAEEVPLRLEVMDMPGTSSVAEQLEMFQTYRPSGVVLDTILGSEMCEVVQFFQENKVPVLQVGHVPVVPGLDSVVIDSFGGAHVGTHHLISKGHTRIATIRWSIETDPASGQKFAGFQCAMNEAGLAIRDEYVVVAPPGRSDEGQPGRVAVQRLLDLPEPPTAIFVENSFVSPSLLYPMPPEKRVPPSILELDMVHFEAWSLDWMEQVVCSKLSFPIRHAKLLRIDWYQVGHVSAMRMLSMLKGEVTPGQITRVSPHLARVDGDTEQPLAE